MPQSSELPAVLELTDRLLAALATDDTDRRRQQVNDRLTRCTSGDVECGGQIAQKRTAWCITQCAAGLAVWPHARVTHKFMLPSILRVCSLARQSYHSELVRSASRQDAANALPRVGASRLGLSHEALALCHLSTWHHERALSNRHRCT